MTRGLSPRVRGNPLRCVADDFYSRSIPACAGEPSTRQRLGYVRPVYPRVCGGTEVDAREDINVRGLSPRVRGNLDKSILERGDVRSIPACAGEPTGTIVSQSGNRVYPRVCGGTRSSQCLCRSQRGLSPRVRGNRAVHGVDEVSLRSIPACAGEPWAVIRMPMPWAVYPRVCGGTFQTS